MMKLALLCLVLCVGISYQAEEDVLVLTDSNFDDAIKENSAILVEFYAPWCGHCKKLAPEYAEAAGQLKGKGAALGKVDATVETEIGKRFSIEGYPTLKFFRDGKPTDYEGGRSASDIVSYMKKQTAPAVQPLLTSADLDEFIPENEEEEVVVVGFGETESEFGEFFNKFASANRMQYTFGSVTDESVATAAGQTMNTVVLYKPFDEKQAVFPGPNTDDGMATFLSGNALPLLGAIGPGNYAKYNSRGIPIVWLFVDKEQASEDAKTELKGIAADFKGKVSMVYLDGPQYARWAGSMGLTGNVWPALATQSTEGLNFGWKEDQKIAGEEVKTWLTGVLDGTVKPTIKSEAIPENPIDSDNVYVVVADSFEDVVNDKTKDVLIEFYAPWCGHCKKLTPIWGEVATALKDEELVVVAKMDATANDAPPAMQVKGFPTLKLVTAVDNTVLDYNGAREKDAIIEFIRTSGKAGK